MGALLDSGMVGNIGLKHLRVIKEDTIRKWDDLGFLEGLDGHEKDNIAQLYENQASYLINEAAVSDSSGSFETVVFPIIRRVFSKLLANDIVSVQAMNLPIGKLFYFIPKIQERGTGNSHSHPYGFPNTTDTFASNNSSYQNTQNLYDRFYENDGGMGNDPATGLFDYSKGQYSAITLNPAAFVTFSAGVVTPLVINNITGATVSSLVLQVTGWATTAEGKLIGPNGQIMDTEEFLASLTVTYSGISRNFNIVTQRYGGGIVDYGTKSLVQFPPQSTGYYNNLVNQTGTMYISVDLQSYSSTSGFSSVVLPSTLALTDFSITFRVYDTLEFEDQIGEVSFDLQSVTVSVTERKLRASWSPELAQDVSAFHNIDAEAELTALLSEQIAAEVDREILRDLRKGAAWTAKWDYNEWRYGGQNGATLQGYTQKDWNQTLMTKINQMSAQIHKTTLRGGANWVVVSSEISAVLDDLEYFHVSNAGPEEDTYNMGIEKVGTLAGRYQVYRDPYFPPNKILIGHKGKSLLDSGYIYAPYVPLQLTPTMYNPFTMTPIKGIMTRYAKKMVNNRYFGVITCLGIVTFSLDALR